MNTPTPQQAAFISAIQDGTESITLHAASGTGKTWTLVESVQGLKCSTAAIAFNKNIADTLAKRMPEHTCRTMNSFGHRSWGKMLKKKLNLNPSKMYALSKEDRYADWEYEWRMAAMQLASKAKHAGILPEGAMGTGKGLMEDTSEAWAFMADTFGIELDIEGYVIKIARDMLTDSIREAWEGLIDFDDQIYMPAVYRSPLDKFDLVLVDEAQDISPIQRSLISRMVGGRLAAVGDRQQAIYAFRGASATSLDDFTEEFESLRLPLSVCFRCPTSVVAEARLIYDHIDPWEGAEAGSVAHLDKWSYDELVPNSVILCRNNQPIVTLAFKFLRNGIGCHVQGRDIGKAMKSTIKKVGKDVEDSTDLIIHLLREQSRLVDNMKARGRVDRVDYILDKFGAIMAVAEGCATKTETLSAIDRMFESKGGKHTLSTIHKAKGLEWDHVYFLDRDLIPSKWAKTKAAHEQEMNLAYVGVTRAMKSLTYIDSERME